VDGIFISYRRDDSAGYAGRLYDRLVAHFGADRVFMDVEGIEPGTDFVVAIEKAVASCRVLIVLIGDEWLNVTDTAGRRRLDDPHDFIRLETSTALARDIRVVPVLLDGTPMPAMDALPQELQPLVRRQAVELTHKQWEATSGELIRTLEKILNASAEPPAPEAAAVIAAASTPDIADAPVTAPPQPTVVTEPPPAPADTTAPTGSRSRMPLWLGLGVLLLAGIGWMLSTVAFKGESRVSVSPTDLRGSAEVSVSRQPATPPVADTTAPAPAQLVSAIDRLDFGKLELGTSKSLDWRLDNTGGEEARTSISLRGNDAGQFQVPVQTCTDGIRANSSCSASIVYRPSSAGEHSAVLVARGSTGVIEVTLSGQAAAKPAAPVPPPVATKPEILTLGASPVSGGAKVCYRVNAADDVFIEPTGGHMNNPSRACVTIALREPTTLTLVAVNRAGQVARQVRATPAADAAPQASGNLPAAGDTWVYRSRGKWPTSPKRLVSITVDKIQGGLIYETMTQLEPDQRPGGTRRSGNASPGFVDWTWLGWEFSPWFITGDAIKTGEWSRITTPELPGGWGEWNTQAQVSGRGSVTVPAGTFGAIEVQVWAKRRATGGQTLANQEPTDVRMSIWYAPQTRRYVKMERTVKSASSLEIERDTIELVRYKTR